MPWHLPSGREVSSPYGHSASYRRRVSMQMADDAYDGALHIGNRVVMVVASKRDRQGTVHCSKDY